MGVLPFDPAGAPATWSASANAFSINDSFNQIQASLPVGVAFNPPAFGAIVGTIKSPEWTEYNFSVQQQFSRSTVFTINYAGNHGARISYQNAWPNAYDQSVYLGPNAYPFYNGAVPIAPPAGNYSTVTEYKQGAISSYQGVTFSLRKQFSNWVSAHVNYTWSHNLDETSNGGLFNYGFEGNNTLLGQIAPQNLAHFNSELGLRHSPLV